MPDYPIFDGVVPHGENGHGCLVPTVQTPEAIVPLLSENDWLSDREIDERCRQLKGIVLGRAEVTPWIYQGNQGSCLPSTVGHACMDRNAEEGEKVVLLSQATLYAWDGIGSNGELIPRRSDSGMALITGIRLLEAIGMAPASVIDPMDYRRQDWPPDWRDHASPNRLLEWKRLPSLQAIKTAIAQPVPVLHGYGGHARCPVWWDPDEKKFHCKNSWRSQPWHYLNEQQVSRGEQQYECFGLYSTVSRR
jgi:hypothetical protein